ncbi:MAG: hypothetical protein ACKVX9_24190 [Blastocatellia bacterium]
MAKMKCPSLNNLLNYTRGELATEERASIMTHLTGDCQSCRENLRWLEEVLSLAAADKSYTLQEDLILQVVAQFRTQSAPPQSSLRQLVARLMFDSFTSPQLAEVRSVSAELTGLAGRQYHYQTEGYDIDLRFDRAEGLEAEELIGQILPRGQQGGPGEKQQQSTEMAHLPVQLLQGEVGIGFAQTDARGVFRFALIQSGMCNLKVRVPEGEINIAAIATARAA